MNATMKLVVKSHVARDLIQSAGLFKSDKLVVWDDRARLSGPCWVLVQALV